MSSLATFFASLYDRAHTLEQEGRFKGNEENKMWRQIGPKNKLSIQPCRRVYSSAGKLCDIALYCVHGKFYAIDARCPHLGGPLDVIVDLEELTEMPVPHAMCPWHLFAYNLTNGSSPQGLKVDTHPVKVQNGNVYVLHETELSLQAYETDI
uniref:Rieske domain-containing protein-like n=1 Tax=Phallusia mammillata TaxID=59560 RepID=A0A6F9DR74_9ASCI|nr:Rieske domain-containing protein-like [Phallusia mammillata]